MLWFLRENCKGNCVVCNFIFKLVILIPNEQIIFIPHANQLRPTGKCASSGQISFEAGLGLFGPGGETKSIRIKRAVDIYGCERRRGSELLVRISALSHSLATWNHNLLTQLLSPQMEGKTRASRFFNAGHIYNSMCIVYFLLQVFSNYSGH